MGHLPHLLLDRGWEGPAVHVNPSQRAHLERVLRLNDGDPVTYTNGTGRRGAGRYRRGAVERGDEESVGRPSDLVVIAAPPENRDRVRFMVEKLAELGVSELRFLATRLGEGKPPRSERLRSWAVAGVEQSKGAWLMRTSDGLVTFASISGPFAVCVQEGDRQVPLARTVVVGPEGGWAPGEVPDSAHRFGLGDTVLRVETAAIVAAARMI
jgi:16S rRNA (uracil1498-N3)-methyltransferase